jgi:hypothetical protein
MLTELLLFCEFIFLEIFAFINQFKPSDICYGKEYLAEIYSGKCGIYFYE